MMFGIPTKDFSVVRCGIFLTKSVHSSMKIRKAVITAAGSDQRHLPLQAVTSQSGASQTALQMLLDEVFSAGITSAAVVVAAGDTEAYRKAAWFSSRSCAYCFSARCSSSGGA